ncbi:MAG: DoxX family membrane protein [Gemmatimonadetes bacterium]|nr:DoxX family membrane protein [Gemmatimonadota bacterium]
MSAKPEMRAPARWIAALRILVGVYFAKAIVTKVGWTLLAGAIPVPGATERWARFLPKRVAEFAAGNPIPWYHDFLMQVAVPNAHLFATLTALGEAAVGIGLTLGLFTGAAATGGLLLVLAYGLASFWRGTSELGFHMMLLASMLIFIGAAAGRVWGLDGWLLRRRRARHGEHAAHPATVVWPAAGR